MDTFSHPFLLCILFLAITFYILSFYGKTRKRLPPGPNGFPIIGNFHQVYQKPIESFVKLARIHGPLMTLKLGSVTTIVASSSDMAKEILQKNNLAFSGRFITEAVAAQPDYNDALTWLPGGPLWAKLRKICTSEIFTMRKLDQLQELRYKVVNNMVKVVEKARDEGEQISIGRLAFGVMWNMQSNTLYSHDMFDLNSKEVDEMRVHMDNVFDKLGRFNFSDFFPFLKPFDLQGIKRSIKVAFDHLHGCIDDVIDHRKREREAGFGREHNVLDVLLDHCQGRGDDQLTLLQAKLILAELFIAGTHTPSVIIEWAIAELLHNPKIMAKAKQEIADNIGPYETISEKDMAKLPYVTSILKETLRLHSPTPLLLPHYSETDVELRGYYIPKHTVIFVNAWAISREESCWDEPEKFIPERFINSECDFQGQQSGFIPFGAGRRICLGYSLAIRIMFLTVVTLIHRFDWKLPDGVAPEDMNMQQKACPTLQKDVPVVAIPL